MWNMSKNGFFAKISPLFAYMGIKNCFELGVSINTHRMWNDHVFCGFDGQNRTRHTLFKRLLSFADRVSPNDDVNKILRYVLFKLNRIDYGTPHLIPACLTDFFPLINKACNWKNLYEVLQEYDFKYAKREPKLNITESKIMKSVPKLLRHHDALFIKLNSLDRLGHKHGPLSDVVKNRVRYFDELLKGLVEALDKDVALIVMSDHGMVPVMDCFDLISFLRDRGLKFGRHYMGFIGATYASFWFRNAKYRNAVMKELSMLEIGSFLTSEDKKELGMDGIGLEYGEEIFAIKEHHVFFPEFYHQRRPPKGMHGYAFGEYDMPIFLMYDDVSIAPLRKKSINFINIMPTVLRLLDLPIPPYVEGKSLI